MKRVIVLILTASMLNSASAQLNAKPTQEVYKTIFEDKELKIEKTKDQYIFIFTGYISRQAKSFSMKNKQSALELVNMAKKMYKNNKRDESYSFTTPGCSYEMKWKDVQLCLYVIPNYERGDIWTIQQYTIDNIQL